MLSFLDVLDEIWDLIESFQRDLLPTFAFSLPLNLGYEYERDMFSSV